MSQRRKSSRKEKVVMTTVALVLFFVCALTIGFSAFESTLYMDGLALDVRPVKNIRVTNVIVDTKSETAKTDHDYNHDNIHGTINLKEANSTITYKVEVTNFGNVEMGILDIYLAEKYSYLNEILDIKMDERTDYQFQEKICNKEGKCTSGIKKDIYITIKYKDGKYNSNNTEFDFILNFDFRSFHKVTYTNIINNNYKDYVMDGGDFEQTFTRPYPVGILAYENGTSRDFAYNYDTETVTVTNVTNNLDLRPSGRIFAIEDLVNLSENVNAGLSFSGLTFTMERSLDFQTTDSYRRYNRTDYGDINGINGTQQLLTELTTGSGFVPIGYTLTTAVSSVVPFQGNFDGKNYILDNLYIMNENLMLIGLFGAIENSKINNLTVSGEVTHLAATWDAGGIVGQTRGESTINNCHNKVNVTNNVSNNSSTAGLVGGVLSSGILTVKNSSNAGTMNGNEQVGGLVGYNGGTLTIENSVNYGTVINSVGTSTGGLLGRDNSATNSTTIINSHNDGIVESLSDLNVSSSTGGLIGKIVGIVDIDKSYNTGTVRRPIYSYTISMHISVGGLIGYKDSNPNLSHISKSFNLGSLSGGNRVGGIIGIAIAGGGDGIVIDKCYNLGDINANVITPGAVAVSGGIVGYNQNTMYILNSFNAGSIDSIDGAIGFGYDDFGGNLIIINSYNIGSINGKNTSAGIYTTGKGSDRTKIITLQNAYNGGFIGGGSSIKYGIGYLSSETGVEKNIINTYYENSVSGTNSTFGVTLTAMTAANMKNQTFVDTLNNNLSDIYLSQIDPILKKYTLSTWKLGDNGYPIFADEVMDQSGQANHGLNFAAKWNSDGLTTSDENHTGYVNLGFINYEFEDSVSFVTRVKFNKLGSELGVLQEFLGNWEGAGGGFGLRNNDKLLFNLWGQDLPTPAYKSSGESNTTVSLGVWYTLVGTYDGSKIRLYINGIEESSGDMTGRVKPSRAMLMLGGNSAPKSTAVGNASYTTFTDVLIFDRALTAEEIAKNYSGVPNPVNKDQLLLWYKFN